MIKKTTYLISILLLFCISACKKEFTVKESHEKTIDEVSEWLTSSLGNQQLNTSIFRKSIVKKQEGSTTSAIPKSADLQLKADWANAKTYETPDKIIIEVPLQHEGIFMFNTKPLAKGDSVSKSKSITKLLFFKTVEKIEGYFMTTIADDEYLSKAGVRPQNNTYLEKESEFSGIVIYHDLSGNYNASKRFSKIQPKTAKSHGVNGSQDELKNALPDYCYDQALYEVFGIGCVEISPSWIHCDFVYSQYIGSYTICGNGGGPPPGQGGGPGGGSPIPTNEQIKGQIEDKPFAFFDIDCETLKKWLATAKFEPDQTTIDKLNTFINQAPGHTSQMVANVQKIDDAYSTVVNMDYFPVTVSQLPIVNGERLSPGQFLKYIRTNLNNLTEGATFSPYNAYGIDDQNLWNSTNPKNAIVALDMPGPDNGSVITSYSSTDRWTFTTIHEPKYGAHPVSGNRNFGYTANTDGSYTFYTRGVDRLTSFDATKLQEYTGFPFNEADDLWTSFQNGINNFVQNNGGSSTVKDPETFRPNWQNVKDVIEGRKPLSTLSKDCPD